MNASSVFKYIFFGLVLLCVSNFFEIVAGQSDSWGKLSDDGWSGRRLLKRAVPVTGFNVPKIPVMPQGNSLLKPAVHRTNVGHHHGLGHRHGGHRHVAVGHGKVVGKPVTVPKTPIVLH